MNRLAVCGVNCSTDCQAYGNECAGCNQLNGKVSWAKDIGKDCCPIYTCVKIKGYRSCKECALVPCDIWLIETKNPSVTEELFMKDINSRLNNLNLK